MNSQERILAALNHKEADRIPLMDGPWFTTVERWRKEGLPADVDPYDLFQFEMAGFCCDTSLRLPTEIIEDTDEYHIVKNANGVTMKNWKHATSTPQLLGFTLTTPEIWHELKPLTAYDPKRIDWDGIRKGYDKARAGGKFVYCAFVMGYDQLSSIVGPETLLPAMLTEPEWVEDMFRTFMDLNIACAEEMIARGFEFDGAFLYDDLGYRNGTFFSSAIYREMLFPEHKRICDFCHAQGWKVILHTCGNVYLHIPALIEAGFNCLQPIEVKAGMDLIRLKKEYGDALSFMGGIDVRAMADPDPAVIEEEIRSKITFAKRGGGYIYHSDHSVPDNVSFAQYKRVIELVHTYGKY